MRLRALIVGALTLLIAVPGPSWAGEHEDQGPPRALGVSLPPDPLVVQPGKPARQLVNVYTTGDEPVPVEFHQRALELGDDGAVRVLNEPDARWGPLMKLPQGVFTIKPGAYEQFEIEVDVPARTDPDIYLLGFLVTPQPTSPGSVQVINEIGGYIAIDVPGPRDWRLAARVELPSFVLGGIASGSIEVENIGAASLRFWGDVTKKSWPLGRSEHERLDKRHLPAGRARSLPVSVSPPFGIGIVEVPVRISWPSGGDPSKSLDVAATKQVIVVHPLWIVAAVALVALVLRRLLARRRRAEEGPDGDDEPAPVRAGSREGDF